MCGIVGILGVKPVAEHLVDALKRLEYRGYDSAGIATLEGGHLDAPPRRGQAEESRNAAGARAARRARSASATRAGRRTAGRPRATRIRMRPTALAVVHNGIIENFRELRDELRKERREVRHRDRHRSGGASRHRGNEEGHARRSRRCARRLPRLRGAFALAFLFDGEDDLLIGARKGSPLAIGHGDGEMYLGSDAIALAPFTDTISYLEDGDWAVVTRGGVEIYDAAGAPVERDAVKTAGSALPGRQGQSSPLHGEGNPRAAGSGRRIRSRIISTWRASASCCRANCRSISRTLERVSISACGTAYYAGLVAKYWFERYARLPVEIDIASEFRYREAPLRKGDLADLRFAIGRDRRHAGVAALRARSRGSTCCRWSTCRPRRIARESDVVMPTLAGPEIGVASTKAFTCQLAVLACLAIAAGRARGALSDTDEERKLVRALDRSAAAHERGA